jgi:division protein CdvB (Snf7/Vps24/ESCRT-III family)
MKEEIRKKLENEFGILIVDLKERKLKILKTIREHMDYVWKKRIEFEKAIKSLEEELTEEERIELSDLWENVDSILCREEDYWSNALRVIRNEVVG